MGCDLNTDMHMLIEFGLIQMETNYIHIVLFSPTNAKSAWAQTDKSFLHSILLTLHCTRFSRRSRSYQPTDWTNQPAPKHPTPCQLERNLSRRKKEAGPRKGHSPPNMRESTDSWAWGVAEISGRVCKMITCRTRKEAGSALWKTLLPAVERRIRAMGLGVETQKSLRHTGRRQHETFGVKWTLGKRWSLLTGQSRGTDADSIRSV